MLILVAISAQFRWKIFSPIKFNGTSFWWIWMFFSIDVKVLFLCYQKYGQTTPFYEVSKEFYKFDSSNEILNMWRACALRKLSKFQIKITNQNQFEKMYSLRWESEINLSMSIDIDDYRYRNEVTNEVYSQWITFCVHFSMFESECFYFLKKNIFISIWSKEFPKRWSCFLFASSQLGMSTTIVCLHCIPLGPDLFR